MDLSERASGRIYWQYRNADKLRAWIDTLPAIAQGEIEDPAEIVADILNIDARSGEQLDIIGRIVGITRPPIVQTAEASITAFGPGDDTAPQFGGSQVQFSAGEYSITSMVSDELMRVLIKARIERNNGNATIDNIIRSLQFISEVDQITVNDNQDMTFSVSFGNELSSTVRFALNNYDILPRPQGVRFLGFIESPSLTQFGAEFAIFGDDRAQFNEVFI